MEPQPKTGEAKVFPHGESLTDETIEKDHASKIGQGGLGNVGGKADNVQPEQAAPKPRGQTGEQGE